MTSWPYDLIAEFYDQDMGRSNAGLDIGWYVAHATKAVAGLGGAVIELGCGTGRVTFALAAAQLQVIAVDRSIPMLRELVRKAAAAGLRHWIHPVALDIGRLGLMGQFAAILCPYSTFGYLIDEDDRTRMLAAVRDRLAPHGAFLLDVFIPDAALDRVPDGHEIEDYDRELPSGSWAPAVALTRSRRLLRGVRPGVNRISRHYQFVDRKGGVVRELWTQSDQRVYTSDALQAVLAEAGFTCERTCGDFNEGVSACAPARVTAVVARLAHCRGTRSQCRC